MEWLTVRTWEYRKQAKECWHMWFAWFPVTVKKYPDGAKEKAWWQWVLRKGKLERSWHETYWLYEYKKISNA